jgi:hypothetical protein
MIVFQHLFALLSIFGASWIIADSRASYWIRSRIAQSRYWQLNIFLECPACTSFWIGLVTGSWMANGSSLRVIIHSFAFGLAAAVTSLLLFLAAKWLENHTKGG